MFHLDRRIRYLHCYIVTIKYELNLNLGPLRSISKVGLMPPEILGLMINLFSLRRILIVDPRATTKLASWWELRQGIGKI